MLLVYEALSYCLLSRDADTYIAGYWKGKPEAFVRDAMLFERLLEQVA
jgi:hypothetical protein